MRDTASETLVSRKGHVFRLMTIFGKVKDDIDNTNENDLKLHIQFFRNYQPHYSHFPILLTTIPPTKERIVTPIVINPRL